MMNRIANHHTGGGYEPSALDLSHYHKLISLDGTVHDGRHPIAANAPGRPLVAGRYAAHTRALNTGAIGNALCAMANGDWRSPFACRTFPLPDQVEALVQLNARQCVEHGIPVTRETVLSHGEVELTLGVKQAGKWDFDYDFMDRTTTRDPIAIGDKFRARVLAAIEGLGQGAPCAAPSPRPVLRRGASGGDVRELQSLLNRRGANLDMDGGFGPATFAAVVAFQRRSQLRPDGLVGAMTWAALLPC